MGIVNLDFFPAKFAVKGLLFRTDQLKLYVNSGTFAIPVFTNVATVPALAAGDTLVYPHSTTVGDYTQPDTAFVTSGGIPGDRYTIGTETVNLEALYPGNLQAAGNEIRAGHASIGKVIGGLTMSLRKFGSPTGDLTFRHYDSSGNTRQTFGTLDVSTLPTSFGRITIDGGSGLTINVTDSLAVEYSGGDVNNNVRVEGVGSVVTPNTRNSVSVALPPSWITGVQNIFMILRQDIGTEAVDDNTGTKWTSDSEVAPAIHADMGAIKDMVGVTINLDRTTTTVTEIKIRASIDETFTDSENLRTIKISDLTDDVYEFIRFNRLPEDRQFLQIIGTDAGSLVLAINEIKVLQPTNVTRRHGHLSISPTDTTLNLDGT